MKNKSIWSIFLDYFYVSLIVIFILFNFFNLGYCEETLPGNTVICPSKLTNSLGMTFQLLPAGNFLMGSPETEICHQSDEVQHPVALTNTFYMQTTEVTQKQWKEVMGNNPSYFKNCGEDCPVENVSWNDCQNFIQKLNAMNEGIYRLPTEAEWEYSCRAGSSTAFANGPIIEYSDMWDCTFQKHLVKIGWYCYNFQVTYVGCEDISNSGGPSCVGPHPVAKKECNGWGLYDMHGNVWELCQDWYGKYPAAPATNPVGPKSGSHIVFRGGAWGGNARFCRSATRGHNSKDFKGQNVGFRLIRIYSNN